VAFLSEIRTKSIGMPPDPAATRQWRTRSSTELEPAAALAIARYEGREDVYLFYLDHDGAVATDTFHDSGSRTDPSDTQLRGMREAFVLGLVLAPGLLLLLLLFEHLFVAESENVTGEVPFAKRTQNWVRSDLSCAARETSALIRGDNGQGLGAEHLYGRRDAVAGIRAGLDAGEHRGAVYRG
jgi:hypothetical protein